MNNPHIVRKTTSPISAPPETGIHWINTATNEEFFSIGTVSVTDWIRRGLSSSADSLITTAYNNSGSTIPAFNVIYFNGSTGSLPTMALAQADSELHSTKTYGVTSTSVLNNAQVSVVSSGLLANVNTSAFSEGVGLWLSPTVPGGVTSTKPLSPNHAVFVGFVVRSHPTLGRVEIKIQNGYELEELHNVSITSPTDRQSLVYDNSTQLWKNSSLTKSDVGLNNVDNTSDMNKPVSTATQSAINGKQDLVSGGASSITTTDLTANRVLVSDGSGKVAVSTATSSSMDYLDATSSIQTQLNSKALESQVIKKDGSVTYTANQSMGNHRITDVTDPSNAQDVATKAFVENLVSGLDWKTACHSATITNINLSSAPASIDSHTLDNLQRVLVKDQSTQSQNGIYIFNGAGNAMTRSSDADTWDELVGAVVYIEQGTTNAGAKFNATIISGGTLGVTPVTFTVFSTASSLTGVGTSGYNAYWNGSANITAEQYVNQTRGGFGTDTSIFNGYVKATSGSFTASALTSDDSANNSDVVGTNVSDALDTLDVGKVDLAGDTMTGTLYVQGGSNISGLSATSLFVSDGNPIATQSELTYYNLGFNLPDGDDSYFTEVSGDHITVQHDTAFGIVRTQVTPQVISLYTAVSGIGYVPAIPTELYHVTTKKYTDDKFLPFTGGQLSGNLLVDSGVNTSTLSESNLIFSTDSADNGGTYGRLGSHVFDNTGDITDFVDTMSTYVIAGKDNNVSGAYSRVAIYSDRIEMFSSVDGVTQTPIMPTQPKHVVVKKYADDTFYPKTGGAISGSVSATNLSGTNTGDETNTSIKTKLGVATSSNDGYLSSSDWTTFNNKEPLHFIPKLSGNETFRGYLTQNNSTTIAAENIAAISVNGTATARAVAATNMLTKQVRAAYAVSTPAANAVCGLRCSQVLWSIGSGFRFQTTVAFTDSAYNVGALQYYGIHSVATGLTISSTVSVSSLTNIIAVGSDAGDAGLSVFHNDASGTATKISLNPTDFPANRTAGAVSADIFSIELYNANGSSEVKYRVVNLTTQTVAQGTISTDLPSSATLLTFQGIRTSGSSSNACSMDWTKMGVWSLN